MLWEVLINTTRLYHFLKPVGQFWCNIESGYIWLVDTSTMQKFHSSTSTQTFHGCSLVQKLQNYNVQITVHQFPWIIHLHFIYQILNSNTASLTVLHQLSFSIAVLSHESYKITIYKLSPFPKAFRSTRMSTVLSSDEICLVLKAKYKKSNILSTLCIFPCLPCVAYTF